MYKDLIKGIEIRLQEPLPGWEAQQVLSPIKTREYRQHREDAKQAGVNILLYPGVQDQLEMFFIKRPNHNPNDKHGGQISFPGGQMEEGDNDLIQTAIRETYEEIGVPPDDMRVLGKLSPLYVFVSNFHVQPVVSYIDYKPELSLQESEVDYVLTERLSYFNSEDALAYTDYRVRNIIMRDMPHYKLQNHILWGATAMITSEFVHLVKGL